MSPTKSYLCMVLLLCLAIPHSFAQTVTQTYPKTLYCPDDTIRLGYSNYSGKDAYSVSKPVTSPGTDAAPNSYMTLYYGKDSVRLNYHNHIPYAHIYYVNLASPKGKSILRIHFNDLMNYFPASYVTQHQGDVQFNIPEVYELANIIWMLSSSGQKAKDLNKKGAYYERMKAWFKPYLNHPVFKALASFPDSAVSDKYYSFRENSFAFNFEDKRYGAANTKLLFNGPYYYVFGDQLADSSLFGKLKVQVEDFAAKSDFRKFYKANLPYYQQQLARQQVLLPVKQMWSWLELEFPKRKYQSYRIVCSPLIGGSHSTQNYTSYIDNKRFAESVMFICGTDRYDRQPQLNDRQREGLMSGIVFTEIDHNYVNPESNRYRKLIDSTFADRGAWAKNGNSSEFYSSPMSVFNEYMTHAVFCLYIADHYDKPTAEYVIANREDLMVSRRNFIRFKQFDQQLLNMHEAHKDLKVEALYPMILAWCKVQQSDK